MWHISIDTGGTFTDCLAKSPAGEVIRAKVLSSSRLRGILTEKTGERTYRFAHRWGIGEDIFKGYRFFLTESFSDPGMPAIFIEKIDFQTNLLHLTEDLPGGIRLPGCSFEISAGEEAPILAARLVTRTPLQRPLPPVAMRLGTTKGTNALLEKKGACTAMLITQGFGDLLAIGTQQRPHLFQLNIPAPELLYAQVVEVPERIDAAGNVIQPLTEESLEHIAAVLKNNGVTSVAVALLHAWRNPAHELSLREALRRAGFPFLSLSHELMPAIKILPRAQTAVVNAYLAPVLADYLKNIVGSLSPASAAPPVSMSSLKIMTSAGGLSDVSRFYPKDSLLSGPAGGVIGAAAIAQSMGFQKIITLDMGGTSTDTARFDGHFDYEYTTRIAGIEMLSPCLSIETVAAGGGSICRFDGYKLCVGPESAGASPGPACYGAGGPLTVTDVNLLLDKLDPSAMSVPVSRKRAQQALAAVQDAIYAKTGARYTSEELLRGFEKIANEKMAEAIRKISIAKGFDPQDYALLAFGGAGGLHACGIAELLGITTILLPYDAGLLSACGIGQAQVERFAQRQVLKKLHDCADELAAYTALLLTEASMALEAEGFSKNETEVKSWSVYLRLAGQENSLELSLPVSESQIDINSLEQEFEGKYRKLFGHYPGNLAVEVESVKVIVSSTAIQSGRLATDQYAEGSRKRLPLPLTQDGTPCYHWDDLSGGQRLEGPAILLNDTSTALLEKGWHLEVMAGKNLLCKRQSPEQPSDADGTGVTVERTGIDPIGLELFTNRFSSIAEQMGAQLQRTAFSVNVKERLDFSCALLDAEAKLLVNAPHIPVHLGSLGICVRLVKEKLPLGPGDVAITNHPRYGGSHLPDVTLMSAVYASDFPANASTSTGHRPLPPLIGYVVNRAHHAEIGGSLPGSMPPGATTLEQEGVAIPPLYLVKNGQVQWEVIEEMLVGSPYPTRALHENLADISAALASLRAGEEKLRALAAEHGLGKVRHYMQALQTSAAEALREVVAPFQGRHFSAAEKLDDGHVLKASIDISPEKMLIDFRGTSTTHPFNLNANLAIVYSAVMYVLRLLCGKDIPLNEGLMRHVEILLPEGTFLHPAFRDNPARCPAVVGGNTEVSQRLVDTLLKALSPITCTACSQGTMNNFLFGNERFGYYETIGGGAGAGQGFHGRSAVHQHMTNTRITDPEELERRYPVRLLRFAIRTGSGGNGRWRGGDGIVRELEFLEPVDLTLLSQHRVEAPYGLKGGQAGSRGRQYIVRKNGKVEMLQGIDSRRMLPGDRMVIETPGGGGFGEVE